jgi:hypothetical protein
LAVPLAGQAAARFLAFPTEHGHSKRRTNDIHCECRGHPLLQRLNAPSFVVCDKVYPEDSQRFEQALAFAWDARDWRFCTQRLGLVPTSMPQFGLF